MILENGRSVCLLDRLRCGGVPGKAHPNEPRLGDLLHNNDAMTSKKFKAASCATIAVFAAIAGYWYWSPLLSVRQLQFAAVERDAKTFNQHVDYPKVRESIKGQFAPMFSDAPGAPGAPGESGNSGAAFGRKMGMGMVNRYVDGELRPQRLMRSIASGQLSARNPGQAPDSDGKSPWQFERQGVNQVLAHVASPGKDGLQPPLGMVLQRSGFATWKLTQVLLPVSAQ
jgi:hypothetical protein